MSRTRRSRSPTRSSPLLRTATRFRQLEAGTQTIELRNRSGTEPSWYLAIPKPGGTSEDFQAWAEGGQKGEAPVTFAGAMQSFPDGESIFVTLDLEAGVTYRLDDDDGGLPSVEFTPR